MAARIDTSIRNKDYTIEVGINALPADHEKMEASLMLPLLVTERKDVTVLIDLPEETEHGVPQTILLAGSQNGIYMELQHSKNDMGRDYPRILAHDHLSIEDANAVLTSILSECSDGIPIIADEFVDVSTEIYSG